MNTLLKWDHPSIALFRRRRWYEFNRNPPGPAFVRITEDGAVRVTEDADIRITETT